MEDKNNNEFNSNSNQNHQEILAIEKKNNQMLILERSLYILKKKFEIHKKELEIVYEKYRHKNYKKLKCINVDYLYELYNEILKTTRFNLIPYTNSKEVISAELMIELNREKRKMVLKSLEKFTLKNIEKYNRIYYDEKMRKKKLLEEEEKKRKEEEKEKNKENLNSEVKIVKIDKRGKIIYNFEEMLENNKEFNIGNNIVSSIDEDDIMILNNNKLLYTDVFRIIIADFLQDYQPGGTYNIAIISMGEDLDGKEDSKLNEEIKKLYDSEIIKVNTNIVKVDPKEEKKENLKSLLLELMNIENQITLYNNLLMQKSVEGSTNVKHIVVYLEKLNEQKKIIQKKTETIKMELRGNISILNNNINLTESNERVGINKKSSNLLKGKKEIKIKLANNKIDKYKYNYNNENFYYNYGVKEPSTKEEFRKNNLLEIFYFYAKQHSFIGQTPTFEEILKSEEHLYLSEFGKFCVEFKIMMKSQKITEIFKKNAINSKEMNFERFVKTLQLLSEYVNEEKKQYLMERIKFTKLKLKELKEKNKNKKGENQEQNDEKNNQQKNSTNKNNNEYKSTNLVYYHQFKTKIESKNKKYKLKKSKANLLVTETQEEFQQKILKLEEDYDKLKAKTKPQLEEEFYQYLEIDEPDIYRKKMIGYLYPFHFRENVSRFPEHSVNIPIKKDPKIEKEIHKMLVKRHEDLLKKKELKQIKEKNILFEKRKKRFEEDNIKLVEKLNKSNDYKQLKINEEKYQKEKINRLTWKMIQDSDYDNFIINNIDSTNKKFDNLFIDKSNQFDGDFSNYLKSIKSKNNENDNLKAFDSKLSINKKLNNNILAYNKSSNNIMSITESNEPKFSQNIFKNKIGNNKRYYLKNSLTSNKLI